MKRIFFLIGFICFVTVSTHAQIMFQRHYGGVEDDGGSTVIETSNGGYFVAGSTLSWGAGNRDIYIVKTNEFGDTLWTKYYGGYDWDAVNSFVKTANEDFLLVGNTSSFGAGASDVFIMKVNNMGDSVLMKTFGGSEDEGCNEVYSCNDNGYVVVGNSCSFASGFSSIYAIRIDSLCDTLWSRNYERGWSNDALAVIQTTDNGFLIAGTTSAGGSPSTDCLIVKTNASGDTLWTKTYGGTDYDGIYSICQTTDGNFLLCGTTRSFGFGSYDYYVIKINPSGDVIWQKNYGGTGMETPGSIIQTLDDGYVIAGLTNSYGAGGYDVYLVKINLNGDTLWTKTYGGTQDDWASSVNETLDGGLIISGYTNSFTGNCDIYLIKTNSNGFAGFEQNISIQPAMSVFPNPCSDILNLKIKIPDHNTVLFEIFNLSGQLFFKTEQENTRNGLFTLDLSDLPKGLYFLTVSAPSTLFSKKIIIQ